LGEGLLSSIAIHHKQKNFDFRYAGGNGKTIFALFSLQRSGQTPQCFFFFFQLCRWEVDIVFAARRPMNVLQGSYLIFCD
jgi:hypothetical protein